MVNHNQKGIETIRKWKVGDEITGDLLERVRTGRQNGKKWRVRRVSVDLVLLAQGTAMDIAADKGYKTWPPKLGGD